MDGLENIFFICMVPILHTERIWLNTATLCGKICEDYSALICCFAPSKEMRWRGHREELRRLWEMDSFSGLSFSFFFFFCGEGLSEIILCSRISWLCLKPLLFIYPPNIWKPMKFTLKITCYFGLSQCPCLYKQLRIKGTLLNLCSDSGAGGDVW